VFKTSYTVTGIVYSEETVVGDIAGTLDVSDKAVVTFLAQNHPEIRDYTVYRNGEMVAMAQRMQDGTYSVVTYHEGLQNGDALSASAGQISVVDDLSDLMGRKDYELMNARYCIVITAFARNFSVNGRLNTYGSVRENEPLVDVDMSWIAPVYNSINHSGKFHYVTQKGWDAYLYSYDEGILDQLAINTNGLHYRLWRSIDGGDYELMSFSNEGYNTFEFVAGSTIEVKSNDSFYYDPIDDIVSAEIEGREFNVDYRLRVYAYDGNGLYRIGETSEQVLYKAGYVTTDVEAVVADGTVNVFYYDSASEQLIVKSSGEAAVYDCAGRQVLTANGNGDTLRIDMSELPSGLYIVKCDNSFFKVIVK